MSSSAADVSVGPLAQIAHAVSDLSRAVAFHRDVLGLRLLFEAPPGLAFFDLGGVRLMLSAAGAAGTPVAASTLYYRVPDVAAAHAALVARGVAFERGPELVARMPDHDLWMAFLRDPDGHLVGLMEERHG